ncbi:MAG: hypothetical protein E7618_03190 [Ruminococcaceae bacterium]|nr:hypothetical protein [Oscillospiraceae bacterium]
MTHPNHPSRNDSSPNTSVRVKTLKNQIGLRIVLVALVLILTVVLVFSLTVAWQTNVVQSGGLTFSAEGWNFSGSMEIDGQTFEIAPGDSGLVALSLKNESASLVAASMTVSKDQLLAKARSKIYFYVDTVVERNGETVDRVYLGKKSSYTYAIFPYGEVVVNETSHNAPPLMWEWQYDTLGYYVLGTEANGIVTVEDYIRPIEYEYDPFQTTFDANGHLLTVDGVTTAEEFLVSLSETDGYAGTIDVSKKTTYGYYPVDVNERNYGVWAYFCTYGEIQTASAEDTELGNQQAALGNVRVNINAQNSREEGTAIGNAAALMQAVGQSGLQMLTLTEDVVLSEPLAVDENTRLMIDLDGHTLTSNSSAAVIDAQSGAEVMVYNGTLSGGGSTLAGVATSGATVTLNQVTVQNVDEGLTILDHQDAEGRDSTVRLINCKVFAKEDALWVKANGAASEKATSIVIEGGEYHGEMYAGILCNGTYYGVDIRITKATVTGYYAGIYFPAKDSLLTVDRSTVEGGTGIVIKGGTVNIVNSTVVGNGDAQEPPSDPADLPVSGWVDTGDGIYLEANYTAWITAVTVSGPDTHVSSLHALAVRQYPLAVPQASLTVTGGTFDSSVSEYLPSGYIETEADGFYTVSEQP